MAARELSFSPDAAPSVVAPVLRSLRGLRADVVQVLQGADSFVTTELRKRVTANGGVVQRHSDSRRIAESWLARAATGMPSPETQTAGPCVLSEDWVAACIEAKQLLRPRAHHWARGCERAVVVVYKLWWPMGLRLRRESGETPLSDDSHEPSGDAAGISAPMATVTPSHPPRPPRVLPDTGRAGQLHGTRLVLLVLDVWNVKPSAADEAACAHVLEELTDQLFAHGATVLPAEAAEGDYTLVAMPRAGWAALKPGAALPAVPTHSLLNWALTGQRGLGCKAESHSWLLDQLAAASAAS